jgi:hypothetical protein
MNVRKTSGNYFHAMGLLTLEFKEIIQTGILYIYEKNV